MDGELAYDPNNSCERGKMLLRANRSMHVHINDGCVEIECDAGIMIDLPPDTEIIEIGFIRTRHRKPRKLRTDIKALLDKVKGWAGAIKPLRPEPVKS